MSHLASAPATQFTANNAARTIHNYSAIITTPINYEDLINGLILIVMPLAAGNVEFDLPTPGAGQGGIGVWIKHNFDASGFTADITPTAPTTIDDIAAYSLTEGQSIYLRYSIEFDNWELIARMP